MRPPVVLTVAGTDSGGGAGIAADLATFAAHAVHGACVVTAVTAQDTTGVHEVHVVPEDVVEAQLRAVLDDLDPVVVKTGMLATAGIVRLVARVCAGRTIVVDPVLRSTTGAGLAAADAVAAFRDDLLPVASLITPNLDEARALADKPNADAASLAGTLAELGTAVVVTGGGSTGTCTDWLAAPGRRPVPIEHRAVPTANDHGTGCTYSAAAAARLAVPPDGQKSVSAPSAQRAPLSLERLLPVARQAARFTSRQLRLSSTWELGRGRGPIAHVSTQRIQEDL